MVLRPGYSEVINDQFILRIASDNKEDFENILKINMDVHGESIKEYIKRVFYKHPRKDEILWFFIKDQYSNKVISTLTLCPLDWEIDGKIFPICEMSFVGSLEEYRKKGFLRILNKYYENAMKEKGYLFSVIRGIQYFYRKFKYEYAIPLDDRIFLPINSIPNNDLKKLEIKKANEEDIPFIRKEYYRLYSKYFIINKFDDKSFSHKFMNDNFDEGVLATYIIKENGKDLCYFSIGQSYDKTGISILTTSYNELQMIKILQFIGEFNTDKELNFEVNLDSPFGKFLLTLGGKPHRHYGWQIKIPNINLFFEFFKEILENRIENSNFKFLSRDVLISNYEQNFLLKFENGKIIDIELSQGYPELEKCDISIPNTMLTKLLLSDKNIDEINHILQDAYVNPTSKSLIEILFPKKVSMPESYY